MLYLSIMSKFVKRLKKLDLVFENALVVGTAFGYLEDLLSVYRTVFVLAQEKPPIKAKNLIYRMPGTDIHGLDHLTAVFLDLEHRDHIGRFVPAMQRHRPDFFIEGHEVLGREYTKAFYNNGYRAISQEGIFHVWKKIK